MVNQKIFVFVIPLFICAVLLMLAIIAIAIWFQKIRKKIETEIGEAEKTRDKVSKMTVKPRKKENKYSKSKRNEDREPGFYESPPMRDEHREILKMKTLPKQEREYNESDCLPTTRDQLAQLAASRQFSRPAVTMPRAINREVSYIECIRGDDDQNSQRMTTFEAEKREPATQTAQKYKSQAATMPRTFERDDIDGNANRMGYSQAKSPNLSHGATLPMHTSPGKEGYGPDMKSRFRGTVPQQQLSYNTNYTSTNGHDGRQEMYEIMEHNSEIYENTGYVDDTGEAVYGNQEVIEQEEWHSQHNAEQPPEYPRYRNSQAKRYQGNDYEEELYENQEIVEQEKRKHTNTHQVELYENYVAEDMYENC